MQTAVVVKGLRIVRTEGIKGMLARLRGMRRPIHSDGFDAAHNTETDRPVPIWKLKVKDKNLSEASPYQSVTVETFAEVMRNLPIDPRGYTFVDVGAGKAKVLILAIEHGFKRAIGVEFCSELCKAGDANLFAVRMLDRAQMICANAANYIFPDEPSVVFLFNPFGPGVMAEVISHLKPNSFLVYAHPKHADSFAFPCLYRSENIGIWRTSTAEARSA